MTSQAKPVQKNPMSGAVLVQESRTWYKDQYRRTVTVAMMLAGALLVSMAIIAVLLVVRPKPEYYAVSQDLRVIPLVPLSEPHISDQGIIDWSAQVVENTIGFDFVHWKSTLQSVRGDYTPAAFDQVVGALKSSGILGKVIDERLVLSAAPVSTPIIVDKGPLGNTYAWKVKFPMMVTYQDARGSASSSTVSVSMIIKRQNTIDYPRGVAIDQVTIE